MEEIVTMFGTHDIPKPLDEEVFNQWLENGRMSKLGYHYLLVVWDDYESQYQPVYLGNREEITQYRTGNVRERLIAAYDLYSESRVY